mgnify:CR=1 FL=1
MLAGMLPSVLAVTEVAAARRAARSEHQERGEQASAASWSRSAGQGDPGGDEMLSAVLAGSDAPLSKPWVMDALAWLLKHANLSGNMLLQLDPARWDSVMLQIRATEPFNLGLRFPVQRMRKAVEAWAQQQPPPQQPPPPPSPPPQQQQQQQQGGNRAP